MALKPLPTVRDIAKASGYSTYTVSYALRDHHRASATARKEIQEIAQRLGWRPNPLVSAYMAHFRSAKPVKYQASLGFLTSSGISERIEDLPVYQKRFFAGAAARASELGYSLQPIWLHEPNLTEQRLKRILKSRGISGLIIPSLVKPTPILKNFDWRAFAAVAGGYVPREPALHRVFGHLIYGMHLLLHKVMELGYKKIAVIFSLNIDARLDYSLLYPIYYEQNQSSFDGWIKHRNYAWPINPEERRTLKQWIKREAPDVIIGQTLVLDLLKEMEIKIPEQIAFASIEWSPETPAIAGLNQLHETRGAMAVDLLSAQLIQNERGIPEIPKLLLVEGRWQGGDSISTVPH